METLTQQPLGAAQYYALPPMGAWHPHNMLGPRQPYNLHNTVHQSPTYSPFSGQLPGYYQHRPQHTQPSYQRHWVVDSRPTAQLLPSYNFNRAVRHSASCSTNSTSSSSVPDAPRGPPRKPKQSGHAIWIGNLPIKTDIHEFKDYCARGAMDEIESIFLIAKSNCAFANFNSRAACEAAIARIQSTTFNGRRLVCRLRMHTSPSAPSSSSSDRADSTCSLASAGSTISSSTSPPTPSSNDGEPLIVRSNSLAQAEDSPKIREMDVISAAEKPREMITRVAERYFIIKSLTVQDLVASVNNGTWEAQAHIEQNLSNAFRNSDNVYLVFSANKSGEYFGLARMTSDMYKQGADRTRNDSVVNIDGAAQDGEPRSITTPATDSAPVGRIHDDSTRGTIFWEADQAASTGSDADDEQPAVRKHFSVEWLSTSRVPFYRLRGLRNPWNALKEVKIARDGTELEPNVGRIVAQCFRSG